MKRPGIYVAAPESERSNLKQLLLDGGCYVKDRRFYLPKGTLMFEEYDHPESEFEYWVPDYVKDFELMVEDIKWMFAYLSEHTPYRLDLNWDTFESIFPEWGIADEVREALTT